MLVLGITGDVGAGKSTITDIFRESGAKIVSADLIAHEKWKEPAVLNRAVERWGEEILLPGGGLNAGRIASIVFSDKEEYDWLCQILHPLIRKEMESRISGMGTWAVAEIPLLFENGVPYWIDKTIYVRASMNKRVQRNRSRGWQKSDILRRESFLLPPVHKIGLADMVIDNDIPLEQQRNFIKTISAKFKECSTLCEVELLFSSYDQALQAGKILLEKNLAREFDILPVFNSSFHKHSTPLTEKFKLYLVTSETNYRDILSIVHAHDLKGYSRIIVRQIRRPGSFLGSFFPEIFEK